MMTEDQRKIVTSVYNHLLATENRGWDSLDDYMEYLEWLSDDQIHREVDVLYEIHSRGRAHCPQEHPIEKCFIPSLVEAVHAIIELYKETNNMHIKNRYILSYYLAMSQADMIIVDGSVNP